MLIMVKLCFDNNLETIKINDCNLKITLYFAIKLLKKYKHKKPKKNKKTKPVISIIDKKFAMSTWVMIFCFLLIYTILFNFIKK